MEKLQKGTKIKVVNNRKSSGLFCTSYSPDFNSFKTDRDSVLGDDGREVIVFGEKVVQDIECYMVEYSDYTGANYCITPCSNVSPIMGDDDRELLGYKLVKPEYNKAAVYIMGFGNQNYPGLIYNKRLISKGGIVDLNGKWIRGEESFFPKLQESGVLDLWFEPVYKSKTIELPKIGDYEGSYSDIDRTISYGCQTLTYQDVKKYVDTINQLKLIGGTIDIGGHNVDISYFKQVYDLLDLKNK